MLRMDQVFCRIACANDFIKSAWSYIKVYKNNVNMASNMEVLVVLGTRISIYVYFTWILLDSNSDREAGDEELFVEALRVDCFRFVIY